MRVSDWGEENQVGDKAGQGEECGVSEDCGRGEESAAIKGFNRSSGAAGRPISLLGKTKRGSPNIAPACRLPHPP